MAPSDVRHGGVNRRPAQWGGVMHRLFGLKGWRADLTAAGFGALAAVALPPVNAIPVLLVAVPGLLALIDGSQTWRVALRRGFCFGLAHHLLGLYWITEAILIESARYWWLVPLAVPALSALLAVFIAAACAGARMAAPGWRRVLLLAGLWTLADLARQFIATGFPWNPWGSVWAVPGPVGDVLIQPAAWIGVPGMTLLTVLLAASPALGWRFCSGAAAVMAVWVGFGLYRLSKPVGAAPGVSVVLVQGNVAQGEKFDQAVAVATFERYLALTQRGVAQARVTAPHTAIAVVWPETASPFLLGQDEGAREAIWEASRPAAAVLAGSVRWDADTPYNSMFVLDGPDHVPGVYDKWHLVPFGEFAPSWVPFAVQLVPGRSFGFGSGPKTFHVPGLPPFGGLICYEAIYPGQIVDEADRPQWLVNITNDAWFGNSTGPRQHLAAVRMRAVEEGLPMMRAANTGITAAFDANGRELARLPMREAAEIVVALPAALGPTPFSREGLTTPLLLSLAACVAALRIIRRSGRPPLVDDAL